VAAGRKGRAADHAAADANVALTERTVEFARTQSALRAARRAEPARNGATVRLLLLQIPGQVLFGLASQVALVLLAATTTAMAVRGDLGVPEAIALVAVIARYLEAFTTLGDLAPGIETATAALRRIRAVRTAPTVPAKPVVPLATPPRIRLESGNHHRVRWAVGVGEEHGAGAPRRPARTDGRPGGVLGCDRAAC
jgi:ATP-binding cassette subfamily B protein IrtB